MQGFDFGFLTILFKVLILALIGVYGAFSFIVIRQVTMMRDTIRTPLGSIWHTAAMIHFILVVGLFLLALIIL